MTSPPASITTRVATEATSSTSCVARIAAPPLAACDRRNRTRRPFDFEVEAAGGLVQQQDRRAGRRDRRGRDEQALAGGQIARMVAVASGAIPSASRNRPAGRVQAAGPQRRPHFVQHRVGEQDRLGLLRAQRGVDARTRRAPGHGDRAAERLVHAGDRQRSSVVLPAPLRPITATISPAPTVRSTS